VKYKTSKNKETVNEEQTHQNNLPSSDERDENPNVFTVNKTIIDEFQLTLHFSRRWSTSCRPGKKWDLWILRNICNKIEEHFEFFTRTLRENFKESYLVICHLSLF
jgi:hypothetical protein